MEPSIQYAQTSDGASIAYWTLGEGPPFVLPSGSTVGSSLRAWRTPEGRAFMERLSTRRMLVRYDHRGFGNSQGAAPDFSPDAMVLDLAAVLDRIGTAPAALCAYFASGPGVLTYAARHPERVSHLVLWGTSTRGFQFLTDDTLRALDALAQADFDLYTQAMAAAVIRSLDTSDDTKTLAQSLRETMTRETARMFLQAQHVNVSDVLPQLRVPTLVLHRRGIQNPSMADVQTLAARIPNARLVLLEGDSSTTYTGDVDSVIAAIEQFLGEGASPAPTAPRAGMVTILFTDMESSTALTQRLGDAKAQELVRAHNSIVRDALKSHSGAEIKHTGDGIMASFPTASSALECAVVIQRAVADHTEQHPETPLGVHMGLNAGEPVAEEQDLFGTAVQLARRICDHAPAGEILVPLVVRELAAGKGFLFADRGETVLRGFEDPVRLFEVRWRDA